ncbi:MAG TPA: phage tail protein [Bryobacteraceae bacterium]|nr:phage tail protein [Bryobacteraceae bacterium]
MSTAFDLKEHAITDAPLLLFDCAFSNGTIENWCTHQVTIGSTSYQARVLHYNLFEVHTSSDQGADGIPKVSISLANADSHFSELERSLGFKGAILTLRFVFFDLRQGIPATDAMTLFQGIFNSPDQITESVFRITATNRMNMQRVLLPQIRIERRCPWAFPTTLAQRQEAVNGGAAQQYSRFYRCGYSPDIVGGAGSLNGVVAFTSCAYTRSDCQGRGMFSRDAAHNVTARFGGIEFLPSGTLVRSYGERGKHWSPIAVNQALYNDFVPLVYGTVWYSPSIVFSRNDGNLTRMEVLLGAGEINSVIKVLVNDIDIPSGRAGTNMTATGWFDLISTGTRNGGFNPDFSDSIGNPLGDPYGNMAALSVVVPNQVSDGNNLPHIKVLLEGLKLPIYAIDGSFTGIQFTNNPAWMLLDILRRCGWELDEIDVTSFAAAAAYADQPIQTQDLHGNPITVARFACNLALTTRRAAGDLIRGIRNTARLFLTYGSGGLLQLRVENTFSLQQPTKPAWSNSTSQFNGGWPSYEFGDGSSGGSGIARRSSGEPSVRVWSRNITDTPNRFSVEFQDALNEYQQDSYSLVDVEDVQTTGQEITAPLTALGIPNYDQAARILKFNLDRSIRGNVYVEFETSVKALGLQPGDLITLTYLKEGFTRQAFRIIKIAPSVNYRTATITVQIHDDAWYDDTNGQVTGNSGARRQPFSEIGLPKPLIGAVLDTNGHVEFGVVETILQASDGSQVDQVQVSFAIPSTVFSGAPGIPLLSLAATVDGNGGTIGGGQTFYYAISSVDAAGIESHLSFIARVAVPSGTDTNTITLTGLSFPSAATTFHVYRGVNPSQLYRIASSQPLAVQFTDTGLAPQVIPPPDPSFDHANFYWRLELQPEYNATIHSASSIGNDALEMTPSAYCGMIVRITRGTGAGQERCINTNSASTVTLTANWDTEPDTTSYFVVTEAAWHAAATAKTSPVQFQIPNRAGATVHITGRAANVNNAESPLGLCTVTRWVIGGGGGLDGDVPPMPSFGFALSSNNGGTLELSGVSFPDLTNTHTITAGTLTIYYWPELNSSAQPNAASDISASDTIINLNTTSTAQPGTYIQLEREVARVDALLSGGSQYQVTRGIDGSNVAAHAAGTVVYGLKQLTQLVPFVPNFFGSPLSGSWSYPVVLPDCRVVSAELFVTNTKGNSPTSSVCLTQTVDSGMRTLSGGQFSFQVESFLAIETGATPDLIVETSRTVRDVYATIRQAPSGGSVELTINQNETAYCSLTIPDGATISNTVDGSSLPPLESGGRLSLDITMVGATNPGADLTVIIRL